MGSSSPGDWSCRRECQQPVPLDGYNACCGCLPSGALGSYSSDNGRGSPRACAANPKWPGPTQLRLRHCSRSRHGSTREGSHPLRLSFAMRSLLGELECWEKLESLRDVQKVGTNRGVWRHQKEEARAFLTLPMPELYLALHLPPATPVPPACT